jgi:hypothetical protein
MQKKALPPSRPEFLGGLQTKKNWGYLHEFSRKKFEKAKKVTKLPALTVSGFALDPDLMTLRI